MKHIFYSVPLSLSRRWFSFPTKKTFILWFVKDPVAGNFYCIAPSVDLIHVYLHLYLTQCLLWLIFHNTSIQQYFRPPRIWIDWNLKNGSNESLSGCIRPLDKAAYKITFKVFQLFMSLYTHITNEVVGYLTTISKQIQDCAQAHAHIQAPVTTKQPQIVFLFCHVFYNVWVLPVPLWSRPRACAIAPFPHCLLGSQITQSRNLFGTILLEIGNGKRSLLESPPNTYIFICSNVTSILNWKMNVFVSLPMVEHITVHYRVDVFLFFLLNKTLVLSIILRE